MPVKPRVRYFTQNIQLAIGAGANLLQTFRNQLDTSYKRAKAYYVIENSNPGVIYQIGIKDDNVIYQDLTNSAAYQATTSVPKKDRFTKADIRAGDNYITISITPLATTTALLNIDVIFLLTDEEENQPILDADEAALINLIRKAKADPIDAEQTLLSKNCGCK